jgi:hypothetical protein
VELSWRPRMNRSAQVLVARAAGATEKGMKPDRGQTRVDPR